MMAEIDAAHDDADTLGGVIEVIAYGLPVGLGLYVHADRRLDARLAGALMGIQAMKGVEIGDGFRTAHRRGSAAHDEMLPGDPDEATRPGSHARPDESTGSPGLSHRSGDCRTGPVASRAG